MASWSCSWWSSRRFDDVSGEEKELLELMDQAMEMEAEDFHLELQDEDAADLRACAGQQHIYNRI